MTLEKPPAAQQGLTLFLCGDVMTGRGVDQILPHPVAPRIFEDYLHSAVDYVERAEAVSGPIPRPVDFDYIWGEALAELDRVGPHARIINLETAVTTSAQPWPDKAVHYHMHPDNVGCLLAARIDCCVLANNHVLDWGERGLRQTLESLHGAGLKTAGAGVDAAEAGAPALIDTPAGRVFVFAFGCVDSGVPEDWAAGLQRAGVELLPDFSERTVAAIARRIAAVKKAGDIVVASIHWGSNWGYAVPHAHRHFAHGLIDSAGVDLVHGHSSHHAKGIEVYHDHLILYGCGDLINDYEGIGDGDPWRSDLALLYFPTLERARGRLLRLAMTPVQVRRMRLQRAASEDLHWLLAMFNTQGRELATRFAASPEGQIVRSDH